MLDIPNMVMIGGNMRNAGKTTLACNIISRFSKTHEVIGIKVTSIQPDDKKFHGNHLELDFKGFSTFEETDTESYKDTSKMLQARAAKVFYIRTEDFFIEQALLHFLSKYINNQLIVCESRSLRDFINPGLFLMMMKSEPAEKAKDVSAFLSKADKVFRYGNDQDEISLFVAEMYFEQGKFKIAD